MTSVGINLSSNRIYIAMLSSQRKGVAINKIIMEELPEDLVKKGEVNDIMAAAENLKSIWRKYRLPGKKLLLGISNQKTIVKEIDIPLIDDSEIKNSLSYQISEYIPIKKDNLIYDYFVIEKSENSSKLMIVGAMKSMIDDFVAVMKYSGLIAQSIDLNSFALFRTYEHILDRNKEDGREIESRLALDIGEGISNIGILDTERMRFPRVTTVSIERFVESLNPIVERDYAFCRGLIDAYDFQANMKESSGGSSGDDKEKPEKDAGKKSVTEMDIADLVKDDRITSVFKKSADDLINEISISVEHFNHDSPKSRIKEIALSGQSIKNIDKYIEEKTGLKVRRMELKDLASDKELSRTSRQDREEIINNLDAPAFGMALRGLMR